jgi:hypothetical protein
MYGYLKLQKYEKKVEQFLLFVNAAFWFQSLNKRIGHIPTKEMQMYSTGAGIAKSV